MTKRSITKKKAAKKTIKKIAKKKAARKTNKKGAKKSVVKKKTPKKVAGKSTAKKTAKKAVPKKSDAKKSTPVKKAATKKPARKKSASSGTSSKQPVSEKKQATAVQPEIFPEDQQDISSVPGPANTGLIPGEDPNRPFDKKAFNKITAKGDPHQHLRLSSKPKGGPKPAGKKPLWNR